jgi:hypothetical protein
MPTRDPNAELRLAISKATELAAKRRRVQLEPAVFGGDTFRLGPWVAGRILRDQSLEVAEELATSIAGSVNKSVPGADLLPATIKIGGDILIGFIERPPIQQF